MAQIALRPIHNNNVVRIVCAALAFFAATWLLLRFASLGGQVGTWHCFGLALFCLLRFGWRLWPGVAAGIFLALLTSGLPTATCASVGLGSALGALAGSLLLERRNFDLRLDRFKDYLKLVAIGAMLAPAASASVDVLIPYISGDLPGQSLRHAWVEDWIADSLGALTIVPTLLLWLNNKPFFQPKKLWLELALLTELTLLAGTTVFLGWQQELFGEYLHSYILLPLLVWAALNFGRRITAIGIIFIFAMSTFSIQQHVGMFALADRSAALDNLWFFVTICSVSAMALAMVLHELHHTEKALRESEANFRSLAESSSALIWLSDTSGEFIWFNRAWLEFTGCSLEQESGYGWREGVHEDDAERCHATYAEAFASRHPFEIEFRLRHHSGRYRTIADHGAPRFDGKGSFLGFTGTCWDITERREAEEALVERERVLRAIYDNSNVAIGFLSTEGRVTHANQRMAELFGYSLEELIGTDYADHINPAQREMVRGKLATLKEIQNELVYIERLYQRKDGSEFWGNLASRRMRDENGNILGLVGVITDMTERKASEKQLRLAAQVFDNSHEGIGEPCVLEDHRLSGKRSDRTNHEDTALRQVLERLLP
jgi:PAS domain S-box-containing protein